MRQPKISREGWAAIYELAQSGTPRKAIAIEFDLNYIYLVRTIKKLEKEGFNND